MHRNGISSMQLLWSDRILTSQCEQSHELLIYMDHMRASSCSDCVWSLNVISWKAGKLDFLWEYIYTDTKSGFKDTAYFNISVLCVPGLSLKLCLCYPGTGLISMKYPALFLKRTLLWFPFYWKGCDMIYSTCLAKYLRIPVWLNRCWHR